MFQVNRTLPVEVKGKEISKRNYKSIYPFNSFMTEVPIM